MEQIIHNNIETIPTEEYVNKKPFPYWCIDNFLLDEKAKAIQNEILRIDDSAWDRYSNPFEQKYTLRDKYNFPPLLKSLFDELTSDKFVDKLSSLVGYKLLLDTSRNFWGVHKYSNGDKLDIHMDAGYHPSLNLKKQVTIGIYLSHDWKEDYGCEFEVWNGTSSASENPILFNKVESISPLFNRFIVFTCNDYSWHGNPNPVNGETDSTRLFITLSYLSDNFNDKNIKTKAFFIETPDYPFDLEKKKLRDLRADSNKYKDIYRL
jgi:hypothetical protein